MVEEIPFRYIDLLSKILFLISDYALGQKR